MLKLTLPLLALLTAGAAVAQTEPATPATPATPAEPAAATSATPATSAMPASAALPRCSAEIRDRCLQDERFARDVARPGGSRDNNAMAYPSSAAAKRRAPRGN